VVELNLLIGGQKGLFAHEAPVQQVQYEVHIFKPKTVQTRAPE
jgi:hypothetical protein